MKLRPPLALLSAMVLLTACGPGISSRPCPRVTEFPAEQQAQAAVEIEGRPAITGMMQAMAGDRAYNREVCR
jgi:hypothetical protein